MYSESQDPNAPRPFRVCEQCGQPTPSRIPQCANCGAISVHAVVANQQARAERRFLHDLFSRATPLTYAILIFNITLYLVMSAVSREGFLESLGRGSDPYTLVAFGAKINDLVIQGEWFRLVTPIFIHIGVLHIFSNSYALWVIGPLVERLYGTARFALLYLLSGIGGDLVSLVWQISQDKPKVPAAGASGAIFGLFGVLAVFGYRYRNELPPNFQRAIRSSVFPVILINLFIGIMVPFIDNAAHMGGLICGALLTLIIPYPAAGARKVSRTGLITIALCVGVIACSFVRAYQESAPYLESRERKQ